MARKGGAKMITKKEREEARRASGEHMVGDESCPLGTIGDRCTCAARFLPGALDTIDELERQRDALRAAMTTQLAGITSIKVTIGSLRITIEDDGEGRFYAMRAERDCSPRFLIAGRWYEMDDESAPDCGAFVTAAEALAAVHAALATEKPAGA